MKLHQRVSITINHHSSISNPFLNATYHETCCDPFSQLGILYYEL